MKTPSPHAAKAVVMKTPVFKPIPIRQASSSKTKKEKQTARIIFSQVQSKADSHVKEVAVSKRESFVEKGAFISKKVFDTFHEEQQHEDTEVEAQQMDYAGVETSPQQFSPTVDQNLDENQDGTKGCTDLHPDKTNIEIDSQHLIPDELLQSINLDYNLSEKIVHHDDQITDEKLDDTNLSDSQFTIPDELLSSLNAYRRESITRHLLATCEEEQRDEHFNDKKSESVVQDHCQEENADHYKKGKSTILMMHFEIETVEDKNWFYTMEFPDQSWTGSHIDVCFYYLTKKSKYDSNRSYEFSIVDCNFMNIIRSIHDVYSADAANFTAGGQKLAAIIPLCLQHCGFYVKKEIDVENHSRYKDKDSLDIFDVSFQESLPQKLNGSLDCGVYMVTYADCLSYGLKVLANEFDLNALHTRYVALLWKYGTRKQDVNAHSDVEAPLRPASLPGGLLYCGGSTISPSTLSEISQSSLYGNR
ncbi:hypothetical protein CQW23_25643 [Capsicum baccatum]|uniref:Ubiquitin-like protease family profile domain-containing protein n=1 Tax=Capsicum baccatum TaxID=33114 RepID=A0A2G2VLK2_CAPBA|nr:hypothetical protein CQW23_25643 [Capsicum baccatum]